VGARLGFPKISVDEDCVCFFEGQFQGCGVGEVCFDDLSSEGCELLGRRGGLVASHA
jgi:hypothetical protein